MGGTQASRALAVRIYYWPARVGWGGYSCFARLKSLVRPLNQTSPRGGYSRAKLHRSELRWLILVARVHSSFFSRQRRLIFSPCIYLYISTSHRSRTNVRTTKIPDRRCKCSPGPMRERKHVSEKGKCCSLVTPNGAFLGKIS